MIVHTKNWALSDVLNYIGLPLFVLLGWDVLIVVLYVVLDQSWASIADIPVSMIGSALAIFISLRNNASYARWWEARTLWGGLVNNSRNFARQVRLYLPGHPAAEPLVVLQIAYVHALRASLRRQDPWAELTELIDGDTRNKLLTTTNLPNAILGEIADRLAALGQRDALDSIRLAAFDRILSELANMQGGAERIKNTPMPPQYRVLPRIIIEVYCLLLPLAMVHDLGLATPLGSTVLGFILLALEKIGHDLENPFDDKINDTPMTAITRMIEINLREGLGHRDIPLPVKPQNGVLW